MKRTGYSASKETTSQERLLELEGEKKDENDLPEFSRQVPLSASRKDEQGQIEMEYGWKESGSSALRIKRIIFKKGIGLGDVFRIDARDGADSISFSHKGSTYILRKTVGEVSRALFKASDKISGIVEEIVGYLRTVLGNEYVISRVESDCWAFDRRIAKGAVRCIDIDSLAPTGRSKLIEMIAERIAELHGKSLVIGRFTLNNLLFCDNDLRISDLRRMRVSRRAPYIIEEFKSILQYLFAIGLASRQDIYAAIALYTARNEGSAMEWYAQKTGKRTNDPFDIAERIEQDVYC